MFSGIGSVEGRIYLFGGKEKDTKLITNKAYQLQRKDEKLQLVSINRMIKNRSRSAVASINSK